MYKGQTWIFPRQERGHIYFPYSSSLCVGIVRNSSTETTWRKVFWKWNYDDISRLPRAEMTSWDVLVVSVHALPKRWRRRQKNQANQNRMLTKRNVFTGPWCFFCTYNFFPCLILFMHNSKLLIIMLLSVITCLNTMNSSSYQLVFRQCIRYWENL